VQSSEFKPQSHFKKKKKKEAHHKKYTNHLFWTKMFKGLLTQGSKKKSEIGAFYKTMP
jgi:hypothetical protein